MERDPSFDVAPALESPETIITYLNHVLASGEASAIADAIGAIARSRGVGTIAKQTGFQGQDISAALSSKVPLEFGMVVQILRVSGIVLTARRRPGIMDDPFYPV
jgi:probable addiction module antidote protein